MKSFIITIILFSVILSFVILNSIYITKVCNKISDLCNSISNIPDHPKALTEMFESWKKSKPVLEFSVRISELERMSDLIESLQSSVKSQNEVEIQKYCILISDHAKYIAQHERISFSSIF